MILGKNIVQNTVTAVDFYELWIKYKFIALDLANEGHIFSALKQQLIAAAKLASARSSLIHSSNNFVWMVKNGNEI